MQRAIGIFIVTVCLLFGGSLLWARHTHMPGFASAAPVELLALAPGFTLGVWLIVGKRFRPRST